MQFLPLMGSVSIYPMILNQSALKKISGKRYEMFYLP